MRRPQRRRHQAEQHNTKEKEGRYGASEVKDAIEGTTDPCSPGALGGEGADWGRRAEGQFGKTTAPDLG